MRNFSSFNVITIIFTCFSYIDYKPINHPVLLCWAFFIHSTSKAFRSDKTRKSNRKQQQIKGNIYGNLNWNFGFSLKIYTKYNYCEKTHIVKKYLKSTWTYSKAKTLSTMNLGWGLNLKNIIFYFKIFKVESFKSYREDTLSLFVLPGWANTAIQALSDVVEGEAENRLSPSGPAAFRGTTWDCESRSLSGNHREVHLPTQVQEGKTSSECFILSHNFSTCWTYRVHVCCSAFWDRVRSGLLCSDVLENTVVSFTRDCSREDNVWGGGKIP